MNYLISGSKRMLSRKWCGQGQRMVSLQTSHFESYGNPQFVTRQIKEQNPKPVRIITSICAIQRYCTKVEIT